MSRNIDTRPGNRFLLALVVTWTVSCDGGATAPDSGNRPPELVDSVPAQALAVGDTAIVDASRYFRDPDGDPLVFTATSSSAAVVTASARVASVTLVAVSAGDTAVSITATDPGGLSARQRFDVTVRPSDRDLLAALYEAAGGGGWTNNDNWLTGEALGDWHGVDTDARGRVVRLDLTDNNLTGALPAELGSLSDLETLSLVGNYLFSPIPPELGNLSNLDSLMLAGAGLSGAIPAELGGLSDLKVLWLSHNALTGAIPPELGRLSKLNHLWLDRNQLTGAIPAELGNLSNLEVLSLAVTAYEETTEEGTTLIPGLSGAIPPEFGKLSSLQRLYLHQNTLTGPIPPELGNLSSLEVLSVALNDLEGAVPPSFGSLASLRELNLAKNEKLSGALPVSLTALGALDALLATGTDLCAPSDAAFAAWLAGVGRRRVSMCGEERVVAAYLTQAVQSAKFPVPLVAGEPALLRVFVMTPGGSDELIPPVRASFYLDDVETHVVDIPGQPVSIPAEIDEGALSRSANAEIPGEVVQPALEMVIEIDPDGTLADGLDITRRIPEQGRMKVDVRFVPLFDLTVVPFLLQTDPDSSVLEIGGADDELFRPTRELLPVGDLDVTVHEPVVTSDDDIDALLTEVEAIRAVEGGTGHYLGMMAAGSTGGGYGVAVLGEPYAFSIMDPVVVAHELGHTMNLLHAPCGGAAGPDPAFPEDDGSIGAWGYDARDGGRLVPPSTPDLMSYCGPNWIGEYHFSSALHFQMKKEREAAARDAPAATILLWGGVYADGVPFLEPSFILDARPSAPRPGDEYEIAGRGDDGRILFSVSFDMPERTDGNGSSGFAFALPAQPGWTSDLASVTLTGPGGSATLDGDSDRPVTILRDPRTRRVRGILRGEPVQARVSADAAGAGTFAHETLFSRGIPRSGM